MPGCLRLPADVMLGRGTRALSFIQGKPFPLGKRMFGGRTPLGVRRPTPNHPPDPRCEPLQVFHGLLKAETPASPTCHLGHITSGTLVTSALMDLFLHKDALNIVLHLHGCEGEYGPGYIRYYRFIIFIFISFS